MKKKSIWTIAIIMGVSFVILLGLQLTYIREMATLGKHLARMADLVVECVYGVPIVHKGVLPCS